MFEWYVYYTSWTRVTGFANILQRHSGLAWRTLQRAQPTLAKASVSPRSRPTHLASSPMCTVALLFPVLSVGSLPELRCDAMRWCSGKAND